MSISLKSDMGPESLKVIVLPEQVTALSNERRPGAVAVVPS